MLAGCWINIIGPHAIQNSLLATYIHDETHAECHIIDTSKDEIRLRIARKPTLSLIDSHENDPDRVRNILTKCRASGPADQHIAFYNVSMQANLHNLFNPPDIQGIFYINQSKEILIKGIVQIFDGELWLPRRLMSSLLMKNSESALLQNHNGNDLLTKRERQILNFLATGAKNAEIAQKMCLSIHTIKTHIYHIYRKLEVQNRTQAVRWANKQSSA